MPSPARMLSRGPRAVMLAASIARWLAAGWRCLLLDGASRNAPHLLVKGEVGGGGQKRPRGWPAGVVERGESGALGNKSHGASPTQRERRVRDSVSSMGVGAPEQLGRRDRNSTATTVCEAYR